MKTLPLAVDDELDAALDAVAADKRRHKAEIVTEVLRRYVETERLKQRMGQLSDAALSRVDQAVRVTVGL